jgi:hypothetical protein
VETSAEEATNGSREISPYTGEPLSAGGSGDDAFEPCTTPIPLDETWVMRKVSGQVAIRTQDIRKSPESACFGSSGRGV